MKNSNQMELNLSTSSQVVTHASPSVSLEIKKALKIRDTSGQSILDLSKNAGPLGLLEKTLRDTLNLVSTPYKRTWKVKATPLGRLVFQLLASVHRTKEKESGQWLTPNAMDSLPPRSEEALKKQYDNNRKGRTTHSTLREQVVYPSPQVMWRTPDAAAGGSNLPGIKRALDEGHLKRPSGQQIQIRLQDQVKEPRLWPTPRASKAMSEKTSNIQARGTDRGKLEERVALESQTETGGTLNPTWVEWLMGYPTGHTDLKP